MKSEASTMCQECAYAATDPLSVLYDANCRGCEVRMVAKSPKFIRDSWYARLSPGEREVFAADVKREFERLEAAKRVHA